jgi:phosphoenolpyruvate carboxylase
VRPVRINFGSVLDERTSVKRLMMLVAQMLKYSDRTAPVRFLIAECESAFTALAALYFARLFGVDADIDISPLFETEKALEAGSRVVEQLLENPHYCAYVRRRRRLCVQTGYSDAGRHLGQPAAAASIERLRLRLIRVMAKRNLDGVELLVFDTHGESIGRGGHPASLSERLDYVDTRATRGFLAEKGVAFKEEVSFQGGDGFLPFMHPATAYAAVRGILVHALAQGVSSADDPFYDEPAYIREVFTTIKEFQVLLMEDPNYGVLLSAFGPNLLFPSGSRPARRQHEDPADIDHARAAELRAIPHNAILQQLGLLANSVGGAGAAIARDPAKFEDLYGRSARLRQLFGIVEYGMALSDPHVTKGYIDSLDPGFWIMRAGEAADAGRHEAMLRCADALEGIGVHERQTRVFRRLHRDFAELAAAGRHRKGADRPGCDALVTPACRQSLRLLHAVRLAVIHEIFLLAVRVPAFSNRHGMTPRQLVARLLLLDVPPVVRLLEEIFPLTPGEAAEEDFGEPADYVSDEAQSYLFENEQLFRPMEQLHRLILRISAAVAHRTGFFG